MKTKKKKFKSSSSHNKSSSESSTDLHTAAVKLAVAQICNTVGYRGAQTSALETLASVTVTYIQSLAKSAAVFANSTGRTECNLYDVIRALEDVHYDVGFKGNSDANKRLCFLRDSSIIRDLMRFVYSTREIPFAKPLPRRRHEFRPNPPCFGNESVELRLRHVPSWLPEFPKIAGAGEETVIPAESGGVTEMKSVTVGELPEKRKKVRFTIDGGGVGAGKSVTKTGSEIDESMMMMILNR